MRRVRRWSAAGLIAAGVTIVAFASFQQGRTDADQRADQRRLREEARGLLADARATGAASATEPPPTTVLRAERGAAIGELSIPDLGVKQVLVEGAGVPELQTGPGHYPHSPLPGHAGNVSIAGHRTTYGAPFNRIDELIAGDRVVIETVEGRFVYRIIGSRIVAPDDVSVVARTDDNRLTLTTCHPEGSARQRLIVYGLLVGDPIGSSSTVTAEPPPILASEDPAGS